MATHQSNRAGASGDHRSILPGAFVRALGCLTVAAIVSAPMTVEAQLSPFAATNVHVLHGDELPQIIPVTVVPAALVLPPGAVQQFTAVVTGTATQVTWTATGGTVTANGTYTAGTIGGPFQVTATVNGSTLSGFAQVAVVALPPSTGYLSDRAWTSMSNGWGPIEKDRSNGESSAGDGRPLAVNGITYAKGLGAHGIADLRYALTGACSGLTAMVGVDDETVGGGTVVFQVWADAAKVYDSGVMTGMMAARIINIPLAGVQTLGLTVTDGGDGNTSDHADWAEARVTCPPDVTAPTVVKVTPTSGAANVPTNGSFTITFSEPMDPATLNKSTIVLVPQAPK